ncbi:hypothetical protein [Streptomyces sp. NPDC054808]
MPHWLITVLITIATALAATVVSSLTITPRLEARNRRIQAGHQDREQFGRAVLAVLTCGARLAGMRIPDDTSPAVRQALTQELDRWRQRIDEATRDLSDSTAPLSFVVPLREVALRFALTTRLVWISERAEDARIEALIELAGLAQGLYFSAWWRRPRRLWCLRRLVAVMDDLESHRR